MRRVKTEKLHSQRSKKDIWLALFAIFFSLFGLLMIFESSNVSAFRDFGDKYYFVREQLKGMGIGIVAMIAVSFIPYKKYYMWALPSIIGVIILLLAVFIPGLGVNAYGANRWLSLGFFNFQPTELAKLVLVFYFAAWFSEKERNRLAPFLLLLGLIIGLVILQPDMGTAVILSSISIFMYFLSGAPLWHFMMLVPTILLGIVMMAVSSPYRLKRLTTFLNPDSDPLGASYHIRQILITLGSGGLLGVGLGSSLQKYEYLPEATTDSIFAIVGEEFGFVGSLVLVIIFIFFILRILRIVVNTNDRHSFLLSGGLLIYFASQMVVNLGAIAALFPLTGVPLPFISFGSSSLVISMVSVGILMNISSYSKNK